MKRAIAIVAAVVVVVLGYLGYRYWQLQSLAALYKNAREVASESIQKDGATWTIRMESVLGAPLAKVWEAMHHPERSQELVPTAFKRSDVTKDEGGRKIVEFDIGLLSLPTQTIVAAIGYDEARHQMALKTLKGMQDIDAVYQLSELDPARTLLVYSAKVVDKVTLPVPQSVVEGALRELFVVQVRAIAKATGGESGGPARAAQAEATATKVCTGPPDAGTLKQVTITVSDAPGSTDAAAGGGEFRNESPQGYDRGYLVDGVPIHEIFRLETRCTTAAALVGGRFQVEVQSVLLSPESLEEWIRKIDFKSLAAVQPAPDNKIGPAQLSGVLPAPRNGWKIVPAEGPPPSPSALVVRVYEQTLF